VATTTLSGHRTQRGCWQRWVLSTFLALAGLGAAAKAAHAYWACVSAYDGCTFSIHCIRYDDTTHEKTGDEFYVEFPC